VNLNGKQIIALIAAALSVIVASTAQMTDLFGAGVAKTIISAAGMLNAFLQIAQTIISSQSGLVRDVQAMPGVERITVNAQANSTLASLAVDPAQEKIEAAPNAVAAIQDTLKKTN